jgi:hypothetical protein
MPATHQIHPNRFARADEALSASSSAPGTRTWCSLPTSKQQHHVLSVATGRS